jgi:hypothetical protein
LTIDIARRALWRPDLDPPSPGNLVANWSFEDPVPGDDPAVVPGWALSPGSSGEIALTAQEAQEPGLRALRVCGRLGGDWRDAEAQAAGATGLLCAAVQAQRFDVGTTRQFLLQGFVADQGAFLAGFLVEWLRDQGGGEELIGRSFCTAARGRGGADEASQLVHAPAGASYGRLSCFVFGGGSAVFDQVSISRQAPPEAEGAKAEPAAIGFRVEREGEPLSVEVREGGTFLVARGSRLLIPQLFAGLDLDRDPLGFGPQTSAVKLRPAEAGQVLLSTEVPDVRSRTMAAIESLARSDGSSVAIRWRLEVAAAATEAAEDGATGEGGDPALVLHVVCADPSLPVVAHGDASTTTEVAKLAGGPFVEIVFGEKDARTSFEFSAPVIASAMAHPVLSRRTLVLLRPAAGSGELGVSIAHGSRREAQAARLVLDEAEELFAGGRDAQALALLEGLDENYPLERAEIERAAQRLRQWEEETRKIEADLELSLAEYRRSPSRVVFDALLARISQLAERYRGTARASGLEAKAAALREVRSAAEEAQRRAAQEALLARAREHFEAQRLGLAELHLRLLLESAAPESPLSRDAQDLLERLRIRQKAASEVLLAR